MSNLNSIYSEWKCRYYFLLLPLTTHAQKETCWENYFNIDILLVIESLLLRQDSEHSSTLQGLGGEGKLMFNFTLCFVNLANGNANQNWDVLLEVIREDAEAAWEQIWASGAAGAAALQSQPQGEHEKCSSGSSSSLRTVGKRESWWYSAVVTPLTAGCLRLSVSRERSEEFSCPGGD